MKLWLGTLLLYFCSYCTIDTSYLDIAIHYNTLHVLTFTMYRYR
jgi:hypothetical protein